MESQKTILKVDFYQHISYHINALKFFQIWFFLPFSVKSYRFWLWLVFRVCLICLVFVIPTASQIIYLVVKIFSGEGELQEAISIINLVFAELLTSIKLFILFCNRSSVAHLIQLFSSREFQVTTTSQQLFLRRAITHSKKLLICLICSGGFDIVVHVLVVPALKNFEELPLKMNFIVFDVNDKKYFNYVFAYQILYKPMILTTMCVLQGLPWACMKFTISQLEILIQIIENMKILVKSTADESKLEEDKAFKVVFLKCVFHHRAILRFVDAMQKTFNVLLITTLMLSACIICTSTVQFMSIKSPMKNIGEVIWVMTYLFIFIVMLFIECYYGNVVTVKCAYISTALYSYPWTNLSKTSKKDFAMFLVKVQQPVVLVALNLVPVNIDTFTKVMNWSYKAFAVMNQMKK